MNIENSPIDRKLIVLEAYLIPFKWNIAEARKKYNEEISARTKTLEELVSDKNSIQFKALEALKTNNNQEYESLMWEIKKQYDLEQAESLQGGTYTAIQKELWLEKKKAQEKPTEPIAIPAENPKVPTEQIIKPTEKPLKIKYEELIEKYKNKMHDIRQKLDNPKKDMGEEEMDAFFAYSITDLLVIQKRKDGRDILKEEIPALKKYLIRAIKRNYPRTILEAYASELRQLEINPEEI